MTRKQNRKLIFKETLGKENSPTPSKTHFIHLHAFHYKNISASRAIGTLSVSCQVMSDSFQDPMDCSPPGSSYPWDFWDKNSGVGCHVLLQGIFPTLGSNLHLLCWQVVYFPLSHQGSPMWTILAVCTLESRHTSFYCVLQILCFFLFVLFIYLFLQIKGLWQPALSKTIGAIFPAAFAHFMSFLVIFW